jgi:hypothetical protein
MQCKSYIIQYTCNKSKPKDEKCGRSLLFFSFFFIKNKTSQVEKFIIREVALLALYVCMNVYSSKKEG